MIDQGESVGYLSASCPARVCCELAKLTGLFTPQSLTGVIFLII